MEIPVDRPQMMISTATAPRDNTDGQGKQSVGTWWRYGLSSEDRLLNGAPSTPCDECRRSGDCGEEQSEGAHGGGRPGQVDGNNACRRRQKAQGRPDPGKERPLIGEREPRVDIVCVHAHSVAADRLTVSANRDHWVTEGSPHRPHKVPLLLLLALASGIRGPSTRLPRVSGSLLRPVTPLDGAVLIIRSPTSDPIERTGATLLASR